MQRVDSKKGGARREQRAARARNKVSVQEFLDEKSALPTHKIVFEED